MVRADVIYLVSESPSAHGVFEPVEKSKRMVYCVVKSVGMKEIYLAKNLDLSPEYVFELADYAEYCGEKTVEYNGVLYDVFRTYVKGQKIEITATRG